MNKPVVICIDDEPIVLESLRRELEEALENKFDIETAVGGIEALDLVESASIPPTAVSMSNCRRYLGLYYAGSQRRRSAAANS